MARVNVDDDIVADERFKALVRRIKDEDKALGLLIRFWRVAQKHWGDERLVPLDEFELGDFGILLDVKLALKESNGIYAVGSEDRFDWYLQKCRAARAKKARKLGLPVPEPINPRLGPESGFRTTENRIPDVRNPDYGHPETEKNQIPDIPPAPALALAPVLPPKPPLTELTSKRAIHDAADVAAVEVFDALMSHDLASVSEEARRIALKAYSSWDKIHALYREAVRAGQVFVFARTLEKAFRPAARSLAKIDARNTGPPKTGTPNKHTASDCGH